MIFESTDNQHNSASPSNSGQEKIQIRVSVSVLSFQNSILLVQIKELIKVESLPKDKSPETLELIKIQSFDSLKSSLK